MEIIGVVTITMHKFYTKINNEIDKKIAALGGSISPGSNDNDTNHPSKWTDDQYREFAKRWINELARMTK